MHKTIKKVSEDIETLKYNTAVAAMMSLLNQFTQQGVNRKEYLDFITLLNPFAPHITEELYERMGGKGMLSVMPWPKYDEDKIKDDMAEIAVQINGKVKDVILLPADCSEEQTKEAALSEEKIKAVICGMQIVKVIVVKNKIVNIVAKPL